MFKDNYTEVTEFILVGLTDRAELQPVLFVVFLVIYLTTVFGNVSMILLIRADSKLQTPMYFFLSHLSFVDLCYATNVTPQMLVHFLSEKKTISRLGCFVQFNFSISLGITGSYVLTVMAYDRYVAICKPLLFGSRMSRGVCVSLVAAPYIYGFANGLAQTILMLRLSFCGPKDINHFYCAEPPLIVLACSDTYVKETAMLIVAGSNLTCSLTIILISYIFIFRAILRIRSAEGRRKAFSTCGSHLTAVFVSYGTRFCMYLRPPSETSVEQGKVVAVFYIFVSPLLNPFIYSLRNKEVKRVIKKVIQEKLLVNSEYIMPHAGLAEAPAEIKIAQRNSNTLRYAGDTTIMAKGKQELKTFLMKDQSCKLVHMAGLHYAHASSTTDCAFVYSAVPSSGEYTGTVMGNNSDTLLWKGEERAVDISLHCCAWVIPVVKEKGTEKHVEDTFSNPVLSVMITVMFMSDSCV
ncbi:olfactory receptor 5M5-like [Muntiacus reevesi]|uniref:olfactory receptor 5M5-like n=1 Tax=Muntiacus reevesi TaxID=9886 RepID=UPI0033075696